MAEIECGEDSTSKGPSGVTDGEESKGEGSWKEEEEAGAVGSKRGTGPKWGAERASSNGRRDEEEWSPK